MLDFGHLKRLLPGESRTYDRIEGAFANLLDRMRREHFFDCCRDRLRGSERETARFRNPPHEGGCDYWNNLDALAGVVRTVADALKAAGAESAVEDWEAVGNSEHQARRLLLCAEEATADEVNLVLSPPSGMDEVRWRNVRAHVVAFANAVLAGLRPIAIPADAPPPPTERGEGGTPPADPYAAIRQFARTNLKGQERAVIEAICDTGGELPLADLTVTAGVEWECPKKGFEGVQRRLKDRLRRHGWTLIRHDSVVKLLTVSPRKTR